MVRRAPRARCRARASTPSRSRSIPGFDFDLSVDDDLEILRRLDELHALGRPLFVALSRKDFLGAVLAGSWEERLGPEEREAATLAATTLARRAGAEILRLHDAERARRDAGRRCDRRCRGSGRPRPTTRRAAACLGAAAARPARSTTAWSTTSAIEPREPDLVAAPGLAPGELVGGARPGRDRRALLAPGRGARGSPPTAT